MSARAALTPFLAVFSALAAPTLHAGSCWFEGSWVYCDLGCNIIRHWVDEYGREWIRYSCQPPLFDDPAPFIAGLVLVLVIAAVLGAIASAASGNSHEQDIQQIATDNTTTADLKRRYEDLEREAEAHIASMLKKARDGDRHG